MKTKVCTKCQKRKLVTSFSKDKKNPTGLCYFCKKCTNLYGKSHYNNRVKSGLCASCGGKNNPPNVNCKKCIKKQSVRSRKQYQDIKFQVINHYCQGRIKCTCPNCPIKHIDLLTVDHIKGNGRKHNKNIGTRGGVGLYLWIIKHKFPSGFQILCGACNIAKHNNKSCPRAGKTH